VALPEQRWLPFCPRWCNSTRHEINGAIHRSKPSVWDTTHDPDCNGWRVVARLYRGDDDIELVPYPDNINTTAIEFDITSARYTLAYDDCERPTLTGWLTPDHARALARWLLTVAEQAELHSEVTSPPAPPRWVLSPRTWTSHAVDPAADHPVGTWIARCGHQISARFGLQDEPPGYCCPTCVRWTQR
jgi:hypothetical protein